MGDAGSPPGVETGTEASLWIIEKKNRARETLLVECVDGKPYSR
jgi:hypothetical protein